MTPETFTKADNIVGEIEQLEEELGAWEVLETAQSAIGGRFRSVPPDAWAEFKRKSKEAVQTLLDKKRAELAAL